MNKPIDVKNIAKKAMTTDGQKASYIIDHLIEALGSDPSCGLRRTLVLIDIDQHENTTQTEIMERLQIHKSALNRDIDWLFNYGCIMRSEGEADARTKTLASCGYAKNALGEALGYFENNHDKCKDFVNLFTRILKQEKPTLRDAKIIATLYEKKDAEKQDVLNHLINSAPSTDNRAFNKLIETGLIEQKDDG